MDSIDLDKLLKLESKIRARNRGYNKPVIAVWGMMNAGKSYLLNMLTQHYDAEYFPTKDIRETATLKFFEGESHIFLDTPGLDANDDDDKIALNGAAKADVVLFVHQPQGELEKIELDFLKQLKESFGGHAEKNIVLVISKADSESQDKIELIEQKALEQCRRYLGFTPTSFQVSGTRFHKGIQQCKEGLVKASHLKELKQHIDRLSINVEKVRKDRKRQELDTLLRAVLDAEEKLNAEKKDLESKLNRDFSMFNNAICSLMDKIKKERSKYMLEKLNFKPQ